MSYELDNYNFSSANTLSAQNPWGNVNRVGLGMRLAYKMNDYWSISGGPVVQSAGRTGKFQQFAFVRWHGLCHV